MTEPIKVGVTGDVPEDAGLLVPAAVTGTGAPISVFRCDGTFFAVDDTCTHEDASLAEGWVEDCQVECPLHGAAFDLRTGDVLCPPATRPVATHAVEIRGDEVWLYPGTPATGT